MGLSQHVARLRRGALAGLALAVATLVLWGAGEVGARRARDAVRDEARHRLEVYSTSLDAALES